MLGFAFMHKYQAGLSVFFFWMEKTEKIPLLSPPSLLVKSSPLTVWAPTVNNRGKVKRINEVHTLKHQLTQINYLFF